MWLSVVSTQRPLWFMVAELTDFYFCANFASMSSPTISRQAVWAKKKRAHLMQILGPFCKSCGTVNCLTFDCIRPMGDAHHRLSSVARMTFYVRQFNAGNLQVLCSACNTRKGAGTVCRYARVVPIAVTLHEEWMQFQIQKQNQSTHIHRVLGEDASNATVL